MHIFYHQKNVAGSIMSLESPCKAERILRIGARRVGRAKNKGYQNVRGPEVFDKPMSTSLKAMIEVQSGGLSVLAQGSCTVDRLITWSTALRIGFGAWTSDRHEIEFHWSRRKKTHILKLKGQSKRVLDVAFEGRKDQMNFLVYLQSNLTSSGHRRGLNVTGDLFYESRSQVGNI
ncbi:hypothetical protein K435DRAFT_794758 [Dendrothele bispora CBS 962.96]|uniref:Uncharacterized protein n=1 Tax=Dendrothele bispora (strain CBS 962.96) TaxID=1314807 RepID=A0A4S8MBC6_DENBC|nr:hypothetical protein K435DRAFT_794758 [Dendrothele bispora CBS 962.96]